MSSTRTVALIGVFASTLTAVAQVTPRPAPRPQAPPAQQGPSRPQSAPRPPTSPTPPARQVASLPEMTAEKAFYYYVAIYGAPANVVERYGSYFDGPNYSRAMANEFERARYQRDIQAKITDAVKNLNFSDKFTFVGSASSDGYTALGEYSFDRHSFPIGPIPTIGFCVDAGRTFFGNCTGTVLHVDVFKFQNAVNAASFSWALPMSEAEAAAFVNSRTVAGSGGANRRVVTRITYSIVNKKGQIEDPSSGRAASFCPFIHSVEVFSDASLSKKLGVIIGQPGVSESAFGPDTEGTARSPSKTIGEYRYIATYYQRPNTPITGTIKLTDVGVELSNEQSGGTTPLNISFFESFAAEKRYKSGGEYINSSRVTRLVRVNYAFGHDFRVIWDSFWLHVGDTPLRFASVEERDRFFVDLAKAMQEWATKYPQYAIMQLNIDQRIFGDY